MGMNRERLIELAREEWSAGSVYIGPDIESLNRFAGLVLEEAAKVCDRRAATYMYSSLANSTALLDAYEIRELK